MKIFDWWTVIWLRQWNTKQCHLLVGYKQQIVGYNCPLTLLNTLIIKTKTYSSAPYFQNILQNSRLSLVMKSFTSAANLKRKSLYSIFARGSYGMVMVRERSMLWLRLIKRKVCDRMWTPVSPQSQTRIHNANLYTLTFCLTKGDTTSCWH